MLQSTQRRHRRSLCTPAQDHLTEGAVVWAEPGDHVTVEIKGGPPSALATIFVAGKVLRQVHLDACGAGRADIPSVNASGQIKVTAGDRVLLTGHLPAGGGA